MSADNLPRPVTPGPWEACTAYSKDCRTGEPMWWISGAGCLGDGECGGFKQQDAEAIAALHPLWDAYDALARRIDAVRALCEALIPHGVMPERDMDSFDLGVADTALRIVALIDGEGVQ